MVRCNDSHSLWIYLNLTQRQVKNTAFNESVCHVRQEGRKTSPPCYVRLLNPRNSNRSLSLYLREITARMFWKIVFSFSAEFLKSSGHNDIRKKEGCFCHMFRWGDERRLSSVFSVGWWVENYWSRAGGSGKGNQRPVGGASRPVTPMSVQHFWVHTKYVFPNIIQPAVHVDVT